MNKCALLLTYLTLVLIGCTTGQVINVTSVLHDEGGIEGIYFCPREDCNQRLVDFILSANNSVDCAFFDLDLVDVIQALDYQSNRIDVKLVLDSDNIHFDRDYIKEDHRSAFMHNKFCIVDESRIISGSMNPTINGVSKNNNNLIIINSSVLAKAYSSEFNEFWSNVFGKGDEINIPKIRLEDISMEILFCPEDNCGRRVEDIISNAEESIYFMTFSFTHTGIANEIVKKIHSNVSVNGIFEKRGTGSEYSKFNLLDYQGADVRKDNSSGVMHHKVFIIDNKIVITGSFNPSNNADTRNDENILIIYSSEVASRYMEEFEYLSKWNTNEEI